MDDPTLDEYLAYGEYLSDKGYVEYERATYRIKDAWTADLPDSEPMEDSE